MQPVLYPPFSPDLAPPDLYVFGKLKTASMGAEFEEEYGLFGNVMGVLNPISRDELEVIFDDE
jgi:hypothetical protein